MRRVESFACHAMAFAVNRDATGTRSIRFWLNLLSTMSNTTTQRCLLTYRDIPSNPEIHDGLRVMSKIPRQNSAPNHCDFRFPKFAFFQLVAHEPEDPTMKKPPSNH